ncbi:MAG: hypothetical protein A2029_10960 [Chloroflexi bacterium RBG_19FT_COMBO_47_9]|nr:MAG: hypothetical protein A2029_10960 [Chloroflexi bacterium RBG_19FT_COMBO_47_9]
MRAEVDLGRVINPERAGQERTQLTRGIVLALRELAQKTDIDAETRDLAAFIGLALWAVWEGIEATIAPWEKRGYWIKADRFRMEWTWSQNLGLELQLAVLKEDWMQVAQIAGKVAGKLRHVKLPQRNRLGTPWTGAWQRLSSQPPRNVIDHSIHSG